MEPQRQPGVLRAAAELRQGWEAVQGLLGSQGLGVGLPQDLVDPVLVGPRRFCFLDEGAELSVKQLDPLERLGPQVQVPLLEQKVLFILMMANRSRLHRTLISNFFLSFFCPLNVFKNDMSCCVGCYQRLFAFQCCAGGMYFYFPAKTAGAAENSQMEPKQQMCGTESPNGLINTKQRSEETTVSGHDGAAGFTEGKVY